MNSRIRLIDDDRGARGDSPTCHPFDSEVLDVQGLSDRCLGNLELVERVLSRFETHLPRELAELERLMEVGDTDQLTLAAHRIKGSSSNVSAAGLQRVAAEIEDLTRAGRVEDIPAKFRNLREQWQRYVDCRAALRRGGDSAEGHSYAPAFEAAIASEKAL
jgi:HPt (histidine-containing phosphotransfer) domain-containing protein